jgi:hypothetical protein
LFIAAGLLYQFVALLVNQQFTLYALEALATQAPDAVLAKGTERSLQYRQQNYISEGTRIPITHIHTASLSILASINALRAQCLQNEILTPKLMHEFLPHCKDYGLHCYH